MSKHDVAIDFLSPKESEEQLKPEALDLLDHIAEILAEEYVQAMKTNPDIDTSTSKKEKKGGKKNESGCLR